MKLSVKVASEIATPQNGGGNTIAEERKKQYGQLIAKAWTDEEFKARLKADPKAGLKEVGIDVPEGHAVHVHEAASDEHHLVIPPKPAGELSDEDLDKMAGGAAAYDRLQRLPCGPFYFK